MTLPQTQVGTKRRQELDGRLRPNESWPANFAGKRTINTPVISLDILPTALDAIGIKPPAEAAFDGKSLLSLLTGQTKQHHETLYWCKEGGEWAVRRGDWKLRCTRDQTELFDLANDPGETTNLSAEKPEMIAALRGAFDAWIAEMADPLSGASKPGAVASPQQILTKREKERERIRAERKAQRAAANKKNK